MKWLRMYTEIVDDPKMKSLEDSEYRAFTYLLFMAAEKEKGGVIPHSLDDISWRLRLPIQQIEKSILKLKNLHILTTEGNGLKFVNWGKRQFVSDNVLNRVKKYREKKKSSETLHETLHETDRTEQNRAEQSRKKTSLSSVKMTCPQEEIVKLYHRILPELPVVKHWTEERQKNLRARWKEETKRQNLEWWEKYFQYVRESSFLMGGGNKKWQPNLEWFVKKSNLVNVIEGKYHNK